MVKSALLAVPSVQVAEVYADADDLPKWSNGKPHVERADVAYALWPEPAGASVEFEITIPRRLHADLGVEQYRTFDAEHFRIRIDYGWHGPCTFISCLDGKALDDASTAVFVVREFLNRHLPKDSQVKFEIVGPTPFHVDCTLQAESGLTEDLSVQCVSDRGYGRYEFRYNDQVFSDLDAAAAELQFRLAHEMQLYYELIRRRNRRMLRAQEVTQGAADLVALNRERGVRASTRRLFGSAFVARDLGLRALEAQLDAAGDRKYAAEYVPSAYARTDSLHAFRRHLEEVANEDFLAPIDNAREVVAFVEGFRSKAYEVAVLSAATVLGGGAGAVAAILTNR